MGDSRFPEILSLQSHEPEWLKAVRWDERGLAQAIVQDHHTGEILMTAWMNREALFLTIARREMIFWSRSRSELWHKGATSGNTMHLIAVFLDCDGDALLFRVELNGARAACHTGRRSCFYRELSDLRTDGVSWEVRSAPLFDPSQVYGKE